jgi:ferrous iron transport protein B
MTAPALTVALVGNPNAGKTTLFNALSGLRQRVGNYPGVTVEIHKGRWRHADSEFHVIDLPGAYSLAARSPDEQIAVDLLLGRAVGEAAPDVVIAVVDASNLERHLYLVTQLFELAKPVVIALNMIDVAHRHGIAVDANKLSEQLGVPVVPIQANKKIGIAALADAVRNAALPKATGLPFPPEFDREVQTLQERLPGLPPMLVRRLLIDVGSETETRLLQTIGNGLPDVLRQARERLATSNCPVPAIEAKTRYAWIKQAVAPAVRKSDRPHVSTTDRLDRIITHRWWGTLIFLVVMALVFQSIFTAAIPLMDLIKAGQGWLEGWVRSSMPPGPLTSLLADGVIAGVGGVVVFLPQILILFGFLSILEDCGYMARAAFLMDKVMSKAGLSGRSFIPLLSSVACAVPGIMATRVIEQPRDRLATILVAPLMSCSARLPVYTILIAAFLTEGHPWWLPGLVLFAMYMIGFVVAPLIALALKRTLLRGPTPIFVMEMPQYQWPHWGSVLLRMWDRAKAFLVRAGTFILATMIIVWALLYFPSRDESGRSYDLQIAELEAQNDAAVQAKINELNGAWRRQCILGRVGRWIEPAVAPLGWDWKIGMAAIASFPAREVIVGVMGQIYNLGRGEVDDLAEPLGHALQSARWHDEPNGRPVFTIPTALSVMVFFALCCQCVSTLAVIRRETGTWKWPVFTFVYMTVLAYVAAFVVYQIGSRVA